MYKTVTAFLSLLINQIVFINFFNNFSFTFIRMSKNSSAKYYQDNKETLQKKARERYQSLSKEEKEKKAIIWSWMEQKSTRRQKTKTGGL